MYKERWCADSWRLIYEQILWWKMTSLCAVTLLVSPRIRRLLSDFRWDWRWSPFHVLLLIIWWFKCDTFFTKMSFISDEFFWLDDYNKLELCLVGEPRLLQILFVELWAEDNVCNVIIYVRSYVFVWHFTNAMAFVVSWSAYGSVY